MNYKFTYQEKESVRLSDINLDLIPNVLSKSQWKKMIKKSVVFCNDSVGTTSLWINTGDEIEVKWVLVNEQTSKVFPLKLEVVYEDDYLAVVNKPPGLPISGNVFKSLQNALPYNLTVSKAMGVGDQFKTCHRLDYSTSGLVLIAKTMACRQQLGVYFEEKTIEKSYYAILQGTLEEKEGIWEQDVNEKPALSTYKVIKEVPSLKNKNLSLVELSPKTGRTHQLRIHSASNGNCIIGDKKYGDQNDMLKGKGLFLTAYQLKFIHPITKKNIEVSIPLPNKFQKLLSNEERRYLKHHPKQE